MRKTKSTKSQKSFNLFSNKSLQDFVFTALIFAIMLIIISSPKRFTSGTISGLKLFFYSVLPGLFPFMLLTKLLTEIGFLYKTTSKLDKFSRKIFGTPGVSIYALSMSVISGYPIGAKIISDLHEKKLITEQDAKKMSIFCTTSGPIFIIGSVGTMMFGNIKIGIILYVSHIISSIVLGIIYNLFSKEHSCKNTIIHNPQIQTYSKQENIFAKCVSETINSLFVVGAYITIFYLISEMFDAFNIFESLTTITSKLLYFSQIRPETIKGFFYGMIEVTRGCKELSTIASPLSVSICSGILSFSGLSIIMQSMSFLKNAKIKMCSFVLSKLAHMILSIFFCYLLCIAFFFVWRNMFYAVDCRFKTITITLYNR